MVDFKKLRSAKAKVSITKGPRFTFLCCRRNKEVAMQTIKRILLVENYPKDIELTLTALSEHNPANSEMP
jgi:hypothetical protein